VSGPAPQSTKPKRWPAGSSCTIATPKSVELMPKSEEELAAYRKFFPGQLPAAITVPEPYDKDLFTLEGHELHIIEQRQTDSDASTCVYVPSTDLAVGGDVFYNHFHMMVAASTPQSRVNWMADLDRLAASRSRPPASTNTLRRDDRPLSRLGQPLDVADVRPGLTLRGTN
jgi:hypothetical protein